MSAKKAKSIHYEQHALDRMKERSISKEQVESVILNPDWSAPAKRPGAIRSEKRIGKKQFAVITENTPQFTRVVTAWVKKV